MGSRGQSWRVSRSPDGLVTDSDGQSKSAADFYSGASGNGRALFISKLVFRYQRSFRKESCSVTLSNPSHSQDIAHLAELLIF